MGSIENAHSFYANTLRGLDRGGIPVSNNARSESLGFPRRVDRIENTYKEGMLMGPIESLLITKNEKEELYLDIFSTVAASAHTLYAVPYDIFESSWRTHIEFYCNEQGIAIPEQNAPYVWGARSNIDTIIPPDHIPLHLLTWCFLRKVDQKTGKVSYENTDFDDLMGVRFNRKKNEQKLVERHQLDEPLFELRRKEALTIVKNRNDLQAQVILELYNNNLLPVLNQALLNAPPELSPFIQNLFRPLTLANIPTYFASGYYRNADMNGFDGLGGGPQSNKGLHLHALRLPDFMELASIVGHVEGTPVTEEVQHLTIKLARYLSETIPQAKGMLLYVDKSEVSVESFVKQVDYYSTIFFQLFRGWVSEKMHHSFSRDFALSGAEYTIEEFAHHSDVHDVEARFSEGWKIIIPQGDFSDVMIALKPFFQTMHNLWIDTQEALKTYVAHDNSDLFTSLSQDYEVTPDIIKTMKRLRPTQKQIALWMGERADNERMNKTRARIDRLMDQAREKKDVARMAELFTLQALFNPAEVNDTSSLYNIPGVPSFGITYTHDNNDNLILYIGPLLSLKGLAEQYGGLVLERDTGQRS